MAAGHAALALLAALAPSWLPVRVPPVAHLSPNGRVMVTPERDEAFGQVETLTVFADPNTRRARRILRSVADTPPRFLRWHEARVAELKAPPRGGPAYRLRLAYGDETCNVDRAPAESWG